MNEQFHSQKWKYMSRKVLYKNVDSSSIRNSPKLEIIHISTNELWYSNTMEYYSVKRWHKQLIYVTMWVNLKNMVNDRSHTRFHLYEVLEQTNLWWKKSKRVMSCGKRLSIVWKGTLNFQYSAQSSLYVQYIERGACYTGVFTYWNGKKLHT